MPGLAVAELETGHFLHRSFLMTSLMSCVYKHKLLSVKVYLATPLCVDKELKLAKTLATRLLNPIAYETKLNIKNSAAIFNCNLMNIGMEYHWLLQTKE